MICGLDESMGMKMMKISDLPPFCWFKKIDENLKRIDLLREE